jgi:serine/threonine protein kinase
VPKPASTADASNIDATLEPPTRILDPAEQVAAGGPPGPGQKIGDFLLLEKLGAGSFATVYLALQVSLSRQVALKICQTQDSEARTLASLEHEHIVPVFSESVDSQRHLRLLCMKFVPGTTLQKVQQELSGRPTHEWSGQAILQVIETQHRHDATLDMSAARDRSLLAGMDFFEAVCWLGARLAEALAHAHGRGVLHRDIKPANILMNFYGRPLLSDFNLAQLTQGSDSVGQFGGTLRYMAPEHLAAFQAGGGENNAVDERSDVYSLGVVLYELLTGRPIFDNELSGRLSSRTIQDLEQQRRSGTPSARQARPDVPEALDRVLRRCLEPSPAHRYQKAEELGQALEGCRQLRQWECAFPPRPRFLVLARRFPTLLLILLAFVPHLLASTVNIAYNAHAIISGLTAKQCEVFRLTVLTYNAFFYPLCLWFFCRVMGPVVRILKELPGPERLEEDEVAFHRRRVTGAPMLMARLACLGWLPGSIVFPLAIHLLAGPISAGVFGHFLVSCTISGLIATTYAYFGMQTLVVREYYPRLWVDPRMPREKAHEELGGIEGRLRLFQVLAGLIPVSGAVLLLGISGDEPLTGLPRLLVGGLILMGMAGFGVALLASSRISQTLAVLLAPAGQRPA